MLPQNVQVRVSPAMYAVLTGTGGAGSTGPKGEGSKQATSLSLLTFAQRMPRFRHAGTPRYIIHVIRDRYGVLL